MTQTSFSRGDSASLQVSGVEPGARVYLGAGFGGQGIGETIPGLQGTRSDLLGKWFRSARRQQTPAVSRHSR